MKIGSSLLSAYYSGQWIVLLNGVINSTILQEICWSVSKYLSCNREKTTEMKSKEQLVEQAT